MMRRLLALLFTAAPFVAAAVAALSARRDVRMLWMAFAATVVARLVIAGVPRGAGATVAAFAAATVAAAVVAVLFGARAVFGILAVAVVLAGCATVGAAMGSRRNRQHREHKAAPAVK